MKLLRVAAVSFVIAIFGTAVAAPANAGIWNGEWGLPGGYNANCAWYYYQASCGWWSNTWGYHQTDMVDGPLSEMPTDYENHDTIRGQWIYPGQTRGSDPSYLSMSGSLKPHITWWQYNGGVVHEWATEYHDET